MSHQPSGLGKEAETALTRSRVYKLLAVALADPEKGWLVAQKDGFFVSVLKEEIAEYGLIHVGLAVSVLERELGGELGSARIEKLLEEYTALFVHPGVDTQLYQTEYTASHPFMKSDQISDIMGFYRAFGLDMPETNSERGDYLVTELEFMHFLCLKEAQARKQYFGQIYLVVDTEKKFLTEHLGVWVGELSHRVTASGKSPVYSALLQITHQYLEGECKLLDVQPGSIAVKKEDREEAGLCESCVTPAENPEEIG